MTADRAALVDKVANRMKRTDECHPRGCATWEEMADEAIDLIRAEVLEEAARVCDGVSTDVLTRVGREHEPFMRATAEDCAAAIRALKGRE